MSKLNDETLIFGIVGIVLLFVFYIVLLPIQTFSSEDYKTDEIEVIEDDIFLNIPAIVDKGCYEVSNKVSKASDNIVFIVNVQPSKERCENDALEGFQAVYGNLDEGKYKVHSIVFIDDNEPILAGPFEVEVV